MTFYLITNDFILITNYFNLINNNFILVTNDFGLNFFIFNVALILRHTTELVLLSVIVFLKIF